MQDPGAGWARVQLVRGHSGGATWAIDSQYTEARLSIGSAPDAGWCVQAVGVMPYHFEIFWDGRCLWIADTRRVGGVTINGRTVEDWIQIRGRAEVMFGSAGMLVETADAPVAAMASNPGHATRVTLAPEYAASSVGTGSMNISKLVEAPAKSWDDSPLEGDKTRVAQSPGDGGGDAWGAIDPESTRIATEGAVGFPSLGGIAPLAGYAAPPPPPELMRPRLGGSPGAGPDPASRPMARTVTAQEMSQHVEEARRIAGGNLDAPPLVVVQQGYPGMGPQAPLAAGGFAAPPSFDQVAAAQQAEGVGKKKSKSALPIRTLVLLAVTVLAAAGLAFLGPSAATVEVPGLPQVGVPGPLPQAGQTPQAGTPGQPTAAQVAAAGQVAAGQVAAGQVAAGQVAAGQVAAGQVAAGQVAAGQVAAGQVAAGQVAAGQVAAGQVAAGQVAGQVAVAAGQVTAGQAEPGTQPVAPGTQPVAEPGTQPVAVEAPRDAVAEPGAVAVPVGPTPERMAADLVILGRFADALPQYRQLAAQHPERPEYQQMVHILERRAATRCQGGLGPDGRPCAP